MKDVILKEVKCPNCGSPSFNAFYVIVKDFFPIRWSSDDEGALDFIMLKCSSCGWESHPRNLIEIKRLIIERLRG